jgi:hypothetical protein
VALLADGHAFISDKRVFENKMLGAHALHLALWVAPCRWLIGITGERVAKAERLSQLAVGISNALVNIGMLPI